ncbi:hypothetical protein [Streptomyces sp. NPDC047046]|uniref:hypothetical protein n=1 Tax=Streptomyces sp. NPDC047046 TaxID=3155378 RepID=UPI003404FE00
MIGTLGALARAVGLDVSAVEGRDLLLRSRDADVPLHLDRLSADRLDLAHINAPGTITIRSCVIEELVIDHCTADALLVTNSRIGRLTLRNTPPHCEVALADTSVGVLDAHSCGPLRLEDVRVGATLQIAATRGAVRLTRVRTAALTVRSQTVAGRRGRPAVDLAQVHVTESAVFDDLWLAALRLREVDTDTLELRRVRLDAPLEGTGVHCRENLRINGMVVPGDAGALAESSVRGTVEVRGLRRAPALPAPRRRGRPTPVRTAPPAPPTAPEPLALAFRSSTLHRVSLSTGEETPLVVGLDDTVVTEALSLPVGPARFRLSGDSSINEVDLADAVFRGRRQVTQFLEQMFTRVTPHALEAVRATLARRRRTREEDQLYYYIRQAEAARDHWSRRLLARGLLGGVFGWGVRARNPARALVASILATALALWLAGPLAEPPPAHPATLAGRALVMSCALWLNIGVGAPSELKTYPWTGAAVFFTVGGIVFSTLTVGIVIRKLVR